LAMEAAPRFWLGSGMKFEFVMNSNRHVRSDPNPQK
jgi:hypothetical protein